MNLQDKKTKKHIRLYDVIRTLSTETGLSTQEYTTKFLMHSKIKISKLWALNKICKFWKNAVYICNQTGL